MKWSHLPVGGGLYAQNPQLIDRFYYIFAERAKAQAREQAKRDAEAGRGRGGGLSKRARRR